MGAEAAGTTRSTTSNSLPGSDAGVRSVSVAHTHQRPVSSRYAPLLVASAVTMSRPRPSAQVADGDFSRGPSRPGCALRTAMFGAPPGQVSRTRISASATLSSSHAWSALVNSSAPRSSASARRGCSPSRPESHRRTGLADEGCAGKSFVGAGDVTTRMTHHRPGHSWGYRGIQVTDVAPAFMSCRER